MTLDWYQALCQEPWCFTPAEIARLTDWQILELYLKPASERAREFEEKMRRDHPNLGDRPPPTAGPTPTPPSGGGRRGDNGPPGEPGSEEHRSACVNASVAVMGMPRAAAEAMYERQLAEFKLGRARGEY